MPSILILAEWLGGDPNSLRSAFRPGWHIFKFWQGIVDIVLRGIALVRAHYTLGVAFECD